MRDAIEALNDTELDGRTISVRAKEDKPPPRGERFDDDGGPVSGARDGDWTCAGPIIASVLRQLAV